MYPRKSQVSPEVWQEMLAEERARSRANKEKVQAANRRYYHSDKGKLAAQKKREKDPEGFLQRQRDKAKRRYDRLKATNPDALAQANREKHKRAHDRNPEQQRIRGRARYYKQHPLSEDKGRDLLRELQRGLPRSLPKDIRDDVMGEIALGILEGRVNRKSVGLAIRKFITAQYRNLDHHRVLSLDSPLPGKEGQNWVDALASDVEHV